MSNFLTISLSLLFYSCQSDPCVPANTCFEISRHPNPIYQSSVRYTCSGGAVTQHFYGGLTCEGSHTSTSATEIYGGDIVQGSSSGSVVSDYLQGVGCNKLTNPSEQCQDFMVLKHRGFRDDSPCPAGSGGQDGCTGPFLDVGNNCSNYLGNEANFVQYSMVYMPVGCVNLYNSGSKLFSCDANGWSYTRYNESDCQGGIYSAQSENFKTDTCGYFSEWTHCNNGQSTGCVGDGVHYFWWYYYDLICCPIQGKTCCGATSASPGKFNEGCVMTPTDAPIKPTTDAPTQSPLTPTPQPTTSSPVTSEPTTKGPTNAAGTAKPTTGKPTKQPTTPGTAKPTTGAPTNIFGTAKPTSPTNPTTKPPTSPGTARPTVTVVKETKNTESEDKSGILFSIYGMIFGVVVVMYGY